jgi:trehalose/maltose hydrolase-like predicted phosphorylase
MTGPAAMRPIGAATAEPASTWSLVFDGLDPAKEGIREALCTLGNGYFATRGAATWAIADGVHYPGTYLAGGYNRLRTDIAGRSVENEDLVNFPNWLALAFRIGEESWFDPSSAKILSYRQELDLRGGLLLRNIHFEDPQGRRTLLQERRFVSMYDMHLGALELVLTAENWAGAVTIQSGIDGRVVNAGAKLYRKYNGKHLQPQAADGVGEDVVGLLVRTSQSRVHVAQVARTQVFLDGNAIETERQLIEEPGYIGQQLIVDIKQGQNLAIEKMVSLYSSRDNAISECALAAKKAIVHAGRFDVLQSDHVQTWEKLWNRFDVHLQPAGPGTRAIYSGMNSLSSHSSTSAYPKSPERC